MTLTFLLGCGVALYGPAWQSSVGEQVSRSDLPSAVALNSLSFNIARTAGPAIGGVIVARAGPPAAFLINALSWHALTMPALMLGGASWVLALSTFNVTVQTSSPRWVVGRTVAIYQMVTFGGLAVGSWLSGEVAKEFGWSTENATQLDRLIDTGPVVVTVEYQIAVADARRDRNDRSASWIRVGHSGA